MAMLVDAIQNALNPEDHSTCNHMVGSKIRTEWGHSCGETGGGNQENKTA
jgi:hypothetical protein